jgi:protein TonB
MKKLIVQFYSKIDLKRNYLFHYQIGLIISLSIVTTLFRVQITSQADTSVLYEANDEIVFLEETIQTKQEIKAPPPPRPVVPIEVPNDEIIEDEIIFMDSEIHFDEIVYLPPPPEQATEEEEEQEIFVVVEQPPVLIGGLISLQKKVVYPKLAIDAEIEGRVVVEFVITTDGNVTNPRILRGIGGGCDEEAIKVIKTAKFQPGMQRGKKVAVRYSIPISFKLSSKD